MKRLIAKEIEQVIGGNIIVAVSTGLAICATSAKLIDNIATFNEFGRALGEKTFNITHPDQLGQMIYRENDSRKDNN